MLSMTLSTLIYDFNHGINFFTYERQFMTKILRERSSTTRELSGGSIVDIITDIEIILVKKNELPFFDGLLMVLTFSSRIFNLSQNIVSSTSLSSKNALIKFRIFIFLWAFEKSVSNFGHCLINHVVYKHYGNIVRHFVSHYTIKY